MDIHVTEHPCITTEPCTLHEFMRDKPYRVQCQIPDLTLATPVTEYGAVTVLNMALVYCGDFVKITDEVSKIVFYRMKLISNYSGFLIIHAPIIRI